MTRDESATVLIAQVMYREGGVNTVPGEAFVTRYGQTPQWLLTFGLPVPNSPAEAEANYRTWLVRTRLIGLCDEPDVLADVVIDWAVNAGHPVAIRALQKALGVAVDGVLGPETQAALETCDRRSVAALIVAAKVRFRGVLVTGNPTKFARYAKGWLARDAEQIEALA